MDRGELIWCPFKRIVPLRHTASSNSGRTHAIVSEPFEVESSACAPLFVSCSSPECHRLHVHNFTINCVALDVQEQPDLPPSAFSDVVASGEAIFKDRLQIWITDSSSFRKILWKCRGQSQWLPTN